MKRFGMICLITVCLCSLSWASLTFDNVRIFHGILGGAYYEWTASDTINFFCNDANDYLTVKVIFEMDGTPADDINLALGFPEIRIASQEPDFYALYEPDFIKKPWITEDSVGCYCDPFHPVHLVAFRHWDYFSETFISATAETYIKFRNSGIYNIYIKISAHDPSMGWDDCHYVFWPTSGVRDQDGSCEYVIVRTVNFIIEEPCDIPDEPTGLETEDITATSARLDWNSVAEADSYRYYYSTSPSTPPNDAGWHRPGNRSYANIDGLSPNTTYYWWVKSIACDPPLYSSWSSRESFTTCGFASAPSLISPPNGSSTCDRSPTLDWSDVSSCGADKYCVQVSTNSSFTNVIRENSNVTSSNWTVSPDLSIGTYYWRVRTHNDNPNNGGWGSWSSYRSFTITNDVIQNISTPSSPLISGENYTISWSTMCGGISSFDIYYSTDGGVSWQTITTNFMSTSYSWTVPYVYSTDCKFKVCDHSNPSIYMESSEFTIIPCGTDDIIVDAEINDEPNRLAYDAGDYLTDYYCYDYGDPVHINIDLNTTTTTFGSFNIIASFYFQGHFVMESELSNVMPNQDTPYSRYCSFINTLSSDHNVDEIRIIIENYCGEIVDEYTFDDIIILFRGHDASWFNDIIGACDWATSPAAECINSIVSVTPIAPLADDYENVIERNCELVRAFNEFMQTADLNRLVSRLLSQGIELTRQDLGIGLCSVGGVGIALTGVGIPAAVGFYKVCNIVKTVFTCLRPFIDQYIISNYNSFHEFQETHANWSKAYLIAFKIVKYMKDDENPNVRMVIYRGNSDSLWFNAAGDSVFFTGNMAAFAAPCENDTFPMTYNWALIQDPESIQVKFYIGEEIDLCSLAVQRVFGPDSTQKSEWIIFDNIELDSGDVVVIIDSAYSEDSTDFVMLIDKDEDGTTDTTITPEAHIFPCTPPTPEITTTPDPPVSCSGALVQLCGPEPSDSVDGYEWTSDSCNGTVLSTDRCYNAGPGVYYLKVVDDGCWSLCNSVEVLEGETPPVPSPSADEDKICLGGSTVLRSDISGMAAYEWTTGSCDGDVIGNAETLVVSPEEPGAYTYYLKVQNEDGCWSNCGTVVVKAYEVGLAVCDDIYYCGIGDVVITASAVVEPYCASGISYKLFEEGSYIPGSLSPEGNWTIEPPPTETTTYTVKAYCGDLPTCQAEENVVVYILNPAADIQENDQKLCYGDVITLHADASGFTGCSGELKYRWYKSGETPPAWGDVDTFITDPITETTIYILDVCCSSSEECMASDTITLTPIHVFADAGGDTDIVSGTYAVLDASDSYAENCDGELEYKWEYLFGGLLKDWSTEPICTTTILTEDTCFKLTVRCADSVGEVCSGMDSVCIGIIPPPEVYHIEPNSIGDWCVENIIIHGAHFGESMASSQICFDTWTFGNLCLASTHPMVNWSDSLIDWDIIPGIKSGWLYVMNYAGKDSIWLDVTNAPYLSAANVSPDEGTPWTRFTYSITVRDFDGDEPDYANVIIDSSEVVPLISEGGDITEGVIFRGVLNNLSGAPAGHNYYFEVSDDDGATYYPCSGGMPGPEIIDFDWSIVIHAVNQGEIADSGTILGTHTFAIDGFDTTIDYPEAPPPPFGDFIRCYFPHPEWELPDYMTDFNRDIREVYDLTNDTKIWNLIVQKRSEYDTCVLYFELNMPDYYDVFLVDASSGGFITKLNSDVTQYCFTFEPSGGYIVQRKFQLVVGPLKSYSYNAGWNLISVPYVPYNPYSYAVFGDDISPIWIFGGYSCDHPSGYEVADFIDTCAGYWLGLMEDAIIDVEGTQITSDTIEYCIHPGWNLIGCPLPWSIPKESIEFYIPGIGILSWAEITPHIINDEIFTIYNGGYIRTDYLNPWRGFWLGMLTSRYGNVKMKIPTNSQSTALPAMIPQEANQNMEYSENYWRFTIMAENDSGAYDSITTMGVSETATDSYDSEYDNPEPPMGYGNYITVFFEHNWGIPTGNRFNTDIRYPIGDENAKVWDMSVISSSENVTITWNPPPISGYNWTLKPDTSSSSWINMKTTNHYSYTSPSGTEKHFEVYVSNIPLLDNQHEKIPQTISMDVIPNPFNSSCRIIVDAKNKGTVEIYSILGEKIAIYDKKPGHSEFIWKADNLSSGIYFVRLKAGDQTIVKRAILIR